VGAGKCAQLCIAQQLGDLAHRPPVFEAVEIAHIPANAFEQFAERMAFIDQSAPQGSFAQPYRGCDAIQL
jgi:hypothetical protein